MILGIQLKVCAQHDLNGYWQDQDNNHFYIRQIDNQLYWFGEDKNGAWANVFAAEIRNNTAATLIRDIKPTIVGEFYDLPKGRATGTGSLTFEISSANELRKTFGAFGSTTLKRSRKPFVLPAEKPQGFSNSAIDGVWKGNDNGVYYMRQVGNKIIWYGEKTNGRTTDFSNIAIGSVLANTISLKWVDVPKGSTMGQGNLRLNVSGNTITKTSGSEFGGSKWTKSSSVSMDISKMNALLKLYAGGISLHLNNYTASNGKPRWYKTNDAYASLPKSWGGKFNISIPEITNEGTFRNYHYYVNDINSVSRRVTMELISVGGRIGNANKVPALKISIPLETEGTEIIGRCTSCPSSDKGAPDVHITKKSMEYPTIIVMIPLKVISGKLSYDSVYTTFDANIDAGGICSITRNLCDRITGYKTRIPEEIDRGFQQTFTNTTYRTNFENTLNNMLPESARGKLTDVLVMDNSIVLSY